MLRQFGVGDCLLEQVAAYCSAMQKRAGTSVEGF